MRIDITLVRNFKLIANLDMQTAEFLLKLPEVDYARIAAVGLSAGAFLTHIMNST